MSVQEKMTALADAIRSKTGGTAELTLDQMAQAVRSISSSGIDTSDATATAGDMAEGTTAYVGGDKITGTLKEGQPVHSTGKPAYSSGVYGGVTLKLITVENTAREDAILRSGTAYVATAPADEFGDATAEDVRAGKTFTSASGLKLVGTLEI